MINKNLLVGVFILNFVVIILAALFKILHQSYGEELLILALILAVLFSLMCIYEIYSSKRINKSEKIMWTVAFLFFNSFAGLIYILGARERIQRDFKLNL